MGWHTCGCINISLSQGVSLYITRVGPPTITAWFKAHIQLCSIEDGVEVTWEAIGEVNSDLSLGGVIRSVPTASDDREGDLDFQDMLKSPSSGR